MIGESDQRSALKITLSPGVKRQRRELHESMSRLMQPARLQFAINDLNLLIYIKINRWREPARQMLLKPAATLGLEAVRAHSLTS